MLLPSSRGEIKIVKFQCLLTPHVAARTHNNRMVSNLPNAIRNTKKSMVSIAELRQIFPLRENTLRHVVEGDGRYPRAMNPSALEAWIHTWYCVDIVTMSWNHHKVLPLISLSFSMHMKDAFWLQAPRSAAYCVLSDWHSGGPLTRLLKVQFTGRHGDCGLEWQDVTTDCFIHWLFTLQT